MGDYVNLASVYLGRVTEMIRGLFAVYKPSGITSAEVTNILKAVLVSEARSHSPSNSRSSNRGDPKGVSNSAKVKVGHGGTLDKFAEGVLIIGIGEDCKKLGFFQMSVNKCYTVTGRLGVTTDSLDPSGLVTNTKEWKHINEITLLDTLQQFHGQITQSVPMYSAAKHLGKRLSDYARESQEHGIQLPSKLVRIHSISLLNFNPPDFHMSVCCSSGTYMRALVRDIAESLNTVGHVVHLCRTSQGPFTLDHAIHPDMDGQWSLASIQAAIKRCSAVRSCVDPP